MLCDDLLADSRLPKEYPGFDKMQRLIGAASKYVLAPDFAAAADGLVNNIDQLERIVPFCRLPAPVCWFELAQADRPHFMAAPMYYAALQSRPKRVGFLCTAFANEPWHFTATLCWSLSNPPVGGPHNTSIIVVEFDTKQPLTNDGELLSRHVEICMAPFTPPDARALIASHHTEFAKLVQSDWGGEIRYILATLGLLNARNVMEVEAVDRSHNKARARNGKLPLCSHTLLKIRAMHRRSLVGARGQGTSDDVREHFVSGHFKQRTSGIFWWNPFWRGNPQRGRITHDYLVEE